jgi:aromatic ring-opening dioxygenase catalytic subunit (LigB family)
MAKVALVLACSHSPFLFTPPEMWEEIRARRPLSPAVPHDTAEVNRTKYQRCVQAFATLREKIDSVKPDVLLIFGDDHLEQFQFNSMPAFGMYLGDVVEGRSQPVKYLPKDHDPAEYHRRTHGHPELGRKLLGGLIQKGFDVCFSLEMTDKKRGIGHAFMYPAGYLTPNYNYPILPFFVNCYFSPQPTGKRCYELGRAIRKILEECPLDLNVAVVGSGGLWHVPDVPGGYLDENFDRTILEFVAAGNGRQMAEYFDSFEWPYRSASHEAVEKLVGPTGMMGGVGSGAGETRNWIVATAVADGSAGTVIDYVPVYASPCGMGFAYWDPAAV